MGIQEQAFINGEGNAWYHRNKYKPHDELMIPLLIRNEVVPSGILELGCSDGWRLEALRKHFGDVRCHGIEPSQDAVKKGNSKPGINVWEGTAAEMSQATNYNLIIVGFCLYVTSPGEVSRVVANIDRCLWEGGHLVIHDFDPDHVHRVKYEHEEGIFSYKMDWSKLWLAIPNYELVEKIKPTGDTAMWLLRKKSMEETWPLEELIR